MCGIAGIISFNSSIENGEHTLNRMASSLAHRGPDGQGIWLNSTGNIGFAHRRLSIIDLSERSNQPMHYDRFTITFNGEIYNYIELKKELEKKGYKFKTETDTEVVLAAFQEWEDDCVSHFDGMFAFLIWDNLKNEVFGARDRFGEKPLYYYHSKEHFVFASEMKAIFQTNVLQEINESMIYLYLTYDVVENGKNTKETFYKNIFRFPSSHSFRLNMNGKLRLKKYWSLDIRPNSQISFDEAIEKYQFLFKESVKKRLRSDVPIGTSLSGGVDSSSVLAQICELSEITPKSFTARFDDQDYDEGEYVDILRNKFNFDAKMCWPQKEMISDVDKIFYHQEEPFGSTSMLAQWSVMKSARENNTPVLLDGQGADETNSGYFKHFIPYLTDLYNNNPNKFEDELNAINKNLDTPSFLPNKFEKTFVSNLKLKLGEISRPYRLHKIAPDLNTEFLRQNKYIKSPFHNTSDMNNFLEAECFQYGLEKLLRYGDRNSMAFSIEVRLPFLSHELVEFIFSLPYEYRIHDGWTKYLLRSSMKDLVPKQIVWRKDKKGYQAPKSWLESSIANEIYLNSASILQKEGFVSKPDKSKMWNYLMVEKLITTKFKS